MIGRLRLSILPVLLLMLACTPAPLRAESAFEQIRSTISDLAESSSAKPMILAVTKHGRPIFGIAITDPATPAASKTRIVMVAGQHGNEPNSAFAVAELALRWANDDAFADLRKNAVVLMIPAANPDGLAENTRYDSSGADPNRDWSRLSLVETSTIARAIDRWKPHLVLDEHEWSRTDGYRFNCVELSGAAPNQALVGLGKKIRAEAMMPGFSPVDSLPWRDPSLFHRHFLAEGYLTYLIETSPDESLAAKQRLYIELSVSLSRQAVACREAIDSCSASSEHYHLPKQVAASREPSPVVRKAGFPIGAGIGMAAVYCLLLLCGQLRKSSGGFAGESRPMAPRGACVPATTYGMLPEITSRSRASRYSRRWK